MGLSCVTLVRLGCLLIFLVYAIDLNWHSVSAIVIFIGSLFFPREQHPEAAGSHGSQSQQRNPLKGKPRMQEQHLPEDVIHTIEHQICQFVTYDAETTQSLRNFEEIKKNTECSFAAGARLWGSPEWKPELSLEENVLRIVPTFYKFVSLSGVVGIDGFLYELPGEQFAANVEEFGDTVCRLLVVLSDNDPAGIHCMDKSYVDKRGWVFEFNKVTMFVTSFAPFYPESSSRFAFGTSNCYILFQPEILFAQRDLIDDTPRTNWEKPETLRDRIRVSYRDAGRPYHIPETAAPPLAHEIVKPLADNGSTIQWWRHRQCYHGNTLSCPLHNVVLLECSEVESDDFEDGVCGGD